jgi:hypothetical protein
MVEKKRGKSAGQLQYRSSKRVIKSAEFAEHDETIDARLILSLGCEKFVVV